MKNSNKIESFDQVIPFSDVVSEHNFKRIFAYARSAKHWEMQKSYNNHLKFHDPSLREKYDIRINGNFFWKLPLDTNDSLVQNMFDDVKRKIGNDFALDHCYINAQSSLQDGDLHFDADINSNCYTFILYINPVWNTTWGGCTVFINQCQSKPNERQSPAEIKFFDGETTLKAIRYQPTPNSGILFPGHYLHYAEGPSRNFRALRMTLAFKMIKTN